MDTTDDPLRAAALGYLDTFCARILPGTVRRIAAWKQLRGLRLSELLADLRQELAIDCLESARVVVELEPHERNGRWMRLVERWIYHHLVRPRAAEDVHEHLQAPPRWQVTLQPFADIGVPLRNGRWNMAKSAASSGRRAANLRREVDRFVAQLGCDAEYDAFWRARLAEAMTGLAADLLRARGGLRLLPRARRPTDVRDRLRRIRAIGARFHVRPSTIEVRRLLRPWQRRPRLDDDAPLRLLESATLLGPRSAGTWLWLFEAAVQRADPVRAMRAVRRARQCDGAARASIVLARARLLEARGRPAAAVALVRRAARRRRGAARLREALAAITA